ncbi:Uncharacterised protein [Mycobacterium tuberculosis]|nr:Uncharacterised protein [Mycobacterium tuberculosis]
MVIEIITEFCAFRLFSADHNGNQMRIAPQIITDFPQQTGIFRETLHQDVAGAVEGGFGVGNPFFAVHIGGGEDFRIL